VYQFEIENSGKEIVTVFAVFMGLLKKKRGGDYYTLFWMVGLIVSPGKKSVSRCLFLPDGSFPDTIPFLFACAKTFPII